MNTPRDLRDHNCIVYTHIGVAHRGHEWRFIGPARPLNIRVHGNFLANSGEAIREAVLSGIGVAVAPTWMFHHEVAAGLVNDCALRLRAGTVAYPSRTSVAPSGIG